MTKTVIKQNQSVKSRNHQDSQVNFNKIFTDNAHKNIEKFFNLDTFNSTETYYSDRYGWILRRIID